MAVRVGPFVPAAQRPAERWESPVTVAMVTPGAASPVAAATMPTPSFPQPVVQAPANEMTVPASIPPYRPLRPTPMISPARRSSLYIPPVPTPPGEATVEDEGVIEPQIIHTAEFAVPQIAETPLVSPSVVVDEIIPLAAAPDAGELPWIDAFLASTPALPMEAVSATTGDLSVEPPRSLHALPVESGDEPAVAADALEAGEVADEWPLDEAAAEFHALRAVMDRQAAAADPAVVAPLPEWGDDDLMDLMPIRHSGKTPLSSPAIPPDGELWAERAEKAREEAQVFRAMTAAEHSPLEAAAESTAEEAAHALELLARRVRAGELTLPSYDPRMGEPAALVAALAALLGVKLR